MKNANKRTRTIAIFGGYSAGAKTDAFRLASEIGSALARKGFEVLNGGYDGTMKAASQAARQAGGRTIGVTCPSVLERAGRGVRPNEFLDEIIPAPDIVTRIDMMLRMAGGFVVLDGGTGTLSEFAIVWEYVSKGFIPPRPIVVAGDRWDSLIDVMRAHRTSSADCIHHATTATDVAEIFADHAVSGTRVSAMKTMAASINDATCTVGYLREVVDRFVAERAWEPFHDPKNLSASIAIEAAELMEHFQWLRSDELASVRANKQAMAEVGEELADILAYVLSFAGTMDIDLSTALVNKMRKNAVKYPADQYRGRFG